MSLLSFLMMLRHDLKTMMILREIIHLEVRQSLKVMKDSCSLSSFRRRLEELESSKRFSYLSFKLIEDEDSSQIVCFLL